MRNEKRLSRLRVKCASSANGSFRIKFSHLKLKVKRTSFETNRADLKSLRHSFFKLGVTNLVFRMNDQTSVASESYRAITLRCSLQYSIDSLGPANIIGAFAGSEELPGLNFVRY